MYTVRDVILKDIREYRATVKSLFRNGSKSTDEKVIAYQAKIKALESLSRKLNALSII